MQHTIQILLFAFATAITVAAPPATASAAQPQRWAILIGVNDYANLEDLKFTGQDVEALSTRLAASGFSAQHVFLLRDGLKESKYLPIKRNIEQQLDLILRLVGRDDLVLFAFNGHGMHIDGASYLCPAEADINHPRETMLAVDDIYAKLAKSEAAMKLVVIDACRNDPRPAGKRSATPKEDNRKLAVTIERPPDGIKLLASCGAGQVSYEDTDLKHGVFMHFVLEGLSGKADGNKNGKVSLGELYDFASSQTKLHVARKWSDFQVPLEKGELSGVFEFNTSLGDHWQNSIGMSFVSLPAGEFEMGRKEDDPSYKRHFGEDPPEQFKDEFPQHRVRVSRPFYLGQHEVTVGQFRQFAEAEKYQTDAERTGGGTGYDAAKKEYVDEARPEFTWQDGGFPQTDDHPVTNVSWNDAVAFCEWLSDKEGRQYRLPTEAEWEYACRGGTTTMYSHGDDPKKLLAGGNVADRSLKAALKELDFEVLPVTDGFAFTSPVGRFAPNKFGLHDMHGNVWEWCADLYGAEYYAASPARDPKGASAGEVRVVRGGSYGNAAEYCRSAFRDSGEPESRSVMFGFRVLLMP